MTDTDSLVKGHRLPPQIPSIDKKSRNLYSTAIGLRNALEKHVMKNMAVPYADKPRNVDSLTLKSFLLLYNEYMALMFITIKRDNKFGNTRDSGSSRFAEVIERPSKCVSIHCRS